MSQSLRCLALLGLASIAGIPARLYAPTPPESHSLREVKPGSLQADPAFDAWVQKLKSGVSPLVLADAEYKQVAKDFDPVLAQMWEVRKQSGQPGSKEAVKTALKAMNSQTESFQKHPIFPYFAQSLIDSGDMGTEEAMALESDLMAHGGVSCPRKRLVLRELKGTDRAQIRTEDARRYLRTIKEFRSSGFQEEALRSLLYRLDPAALKELNKDLILAAQPFPRLVSTYPELFAEKVELTEKSAVRLSTDEAEKLARAEHCDRALAVLTEAIKTDREKQFLPGIESTSAKVEACFRAKGSRARIAYWENLEPVLKNRYGFAGEALAKRKRGLILWGFDDFETARALFNELLAASEGKFPEVHAETLYTYARISENEGKFEEAIEKFDSFIKTYPNDSKVNDALAALMVLTTSLKRPDDSLKHALDMIGRESLKNPDERDGANLPMALYWAGKIYYEKGQKRNASFFWSRLAQEYYSTFYGSLAHLAIEKLNGKRYLLPPVQVPGFDRQQLFKDFSLAERMILDRAELLLVSGLKAEATCEINEIPVDSSDPRHQFAKAIFQYAAGDWLAAVKTFQNLPKGYRITLPKGMERILFPRSFETTIDAFAHRLGVDPHFANAVIRQESVFNPKAQSPVGARGLMQLMPGTARLEARALTRGYLDAAEAGQVAQVLTDERAISDPTINLALGVHHLNRLLGKYKHPVFVLTSYNANPRATERWLSNIDSSDLIAFIERIPYKETRSYVKLVMRNYFYYKRWYEGPKASLPLMESLLPAGLSDENLQTSMR